MNYQNESSIDMSHYLIENAKFATEIASRKDHDLTFHQNAVSYYKI